MWRYYVSKYKSAIIGIIFLFCMILLVVVGVRTQKPVNVNLDSETFSGKAMGTAVKKTLYAVDKKKLQQIDGQIDACLQQLENQISARIIDSDISKCNRNYAVDGIYTLPDNLLGCLKQEMELYEETDGAFSPCIRPLSTLWGIEDGETTVPDEKDIRYVLDYINASDMEVGKTGIIFHKQGMSIDFGASGKGIACDEVVKLLESTDVAGAVISVGGSIAVYGQKGDGKDWHIGIRDPEGGEDDVMGVLECQGGTFISTSGDYEKYFELDGKRYHHILDPATGYPVDNGLKSVTIICNNGLLSDAMSTACFVMGLEDGMRYAKEKDVDAIFITNDKKVYITDGIKKKFNIKEASYTISK